MNYLEVSFNSYPPGYGEILIAELGEIGFDSFSEEENLLLAYIPEYTYNEHAVHRIIQKYPELTGLNFDIVSLPEKNWNEVWESNYKPVLVAGRCLIRAPFHPSWEDMSHEAKTMGHKASGIEIIIEPKMSFGTAHHETTALMIELLLEEHLVGDSVLDMGCGTGVLAILAAKLGARKVVAIDNDPWAATNAKENKERNNCPSVDVILGEALNIPDDGFDLILANINRNILMEQIPVYACRIRPGGRIFLSGFMPDDLQGIEICAVNNGFRAAGVRTRNNWVAARFDR